MAAQQPRPPLTIAGYQVSFPYKPYGTQIGFLNQFLRAVDQQGNALLEAPTGSGKTACLLAGALAWQRRHIELAAAARARNLTRAMTRARGGGRDAAAAAAAGVAPGKGDSNGADTQGFNPLGTGSDARPSGDGSSSGSDGGASAGPGGAGAAAPADDADGIDDPAEEDEEVPKVPKIYYATRTHSQIAQVRGTRRPACEGTGHWRTRFPARRVQLHAFPVRPADAPRSFLARSQVIRELKRMGYNPRMAVLVGGTRFAHTHVAVCLHWRGLPRA